MERALALARHHLPHPNPRVGAVVVDAGGRVVGEGAHLAAGEPHAEVLALAEAGSRAQGGTLFVTLEPCAHQGRTPPCADAVAVAGLARVVVGTIDPDPRVAGRGITRLEKAHLRVEVGVMGSQVEEADPGYFHHRRSGRPLLTLKMAMTLDGQVAALDGTSQWITGEEARVDAHLLRSEVDAVLTGSGTLEADSPRLDVRLPGYKGRQPRPVVVTGRRLPTSWGRLEGRQPLVVSTRSLPLPPGAEALIVPEGDHQRPDLLAAVEGLGQQGLLHILVEGGPTLAAAFLQAQLVDRGVFYLAGKLAGGTGRGAFTGTWSTLSASNEIEISRVTPVGHDLRVDFLVKN